VPDEEDHDGDAALMLRAAAGDRGAFADVVRRHQRAVFGFLRWASASPTAAEDALQDTFVAAWRHAGDLRGAAVRPWLLTIARRTLARGRRRRAGEPAEVEPLSALGERAGWGSEDPEAIVAAAEQQAVLAAALVRLDDDAREAIALVDLQGLGYVDAAAIAEVTLPAFKSRLHRARLELAASLREEVRRGG
jgi:RNA polymerase sigma-70 factor (ECF subfamily)